MSRTAAMCAALLAIGWTGAEGASSVQDEDQTVDWKIFKSSVACLSYLALGSTAEEGKYAEQIKSGLQTVADGVNGDEVTKSGHSGFIAVFPMLFLAEVLYDKEKLKDAGLRKTIKERLQKLVRLVEAGQKDGIGSADGAEGTGAWGYSIGEGRNHGRRKAQATACCLIGLLAARKAGVEVSKDAITKAMDYLRRCVAETGQVGYQGPQTPEDYAGYGRTAGMLYCARALGQEGTPEYQRGLKWLDARRPEKDFDAHGGAFVSWAFVWGGVFHQVRGGPEADRYFKRLEEMFAGVRGEDGGWNGKKWTSKDDPKKQWLYPYQTELSLFGLLMKGGGIKVLSLDR